jgi:hypothetical protein
MVQGDLELVALEASHRRLDEDFAFAAK